MRSRNTVTNGESRGQSLVEFALILPVFVLLIVGILDFGRAVFAFNTLNNAAREGARVAIVDQTLTHVQDMAASRTGFLDVPPSDVTVDFRDPDAVDTANSCDGAPGQNAIVGCLAVVRVTYDYNAATPILSQLIGTIPLVGESMFRVESNCAEPTAPSCPIGD
ncbi:MAG TPA: TadE family protein [Candidatus Limnocylindria bacterium]|nr:TadE family protein [Candidatus Limnocylindria bacterium]